MTTARPHPARLLRRGLLVAVVLGLAWLVLRPDPRLVDRAIIDRGVVEQSFEAEGRTRVIDRFVLTAPVAAMLRRVEIEPGETVAVGAVLAVLEPLPAAALDPRARAQALAAIEAAGSTHAAALQAVAAAESVATQSRADLRRLRQLSSRGLVAAEATEQAASTLQQAERELAARRFAAATAGHQLASAHALLAIGSDREAGVPALRLTAPVDGVVLRRHRQSAQPVAVGEPIVDVGDPSRLEVEVDVLSADAVRLRPDMPVQLLRWGQPEPLAGRVRRIEPGGFTKISALGVEEQRVWTIVTIDSPRDRWPTLGDGYRVDARFVLERRDDVVRVPASALFRSGDDGWAVFRDVDGVARLTPVRRGLDGGTVVELIDSLAPGDVVIAHPDRELRDGDRVSAR